MKRIFAVVVITIYITSSCTESDVTPRPYPRVNTITVESISAEGAIFSGEILYADVPIRDHGFLWSPQGPAVLDHADKVSLGPKDGTGRFEALADWGLVAGTTYYMRAYAISDDHEVYSDIVSFVAKGSSKPTITGIFPDKVTWGDTLRVLGENFSRLSTTNQVYINNALADMIGGNKDTLLVRVPYYLTVEFSSVMISRPDGTSTSPKQMQLKAPDIQAISPASAGEGTTVTITGLHLSNSWTKVYFNGIEAPLTDLKQNAVVVKVPSGLPGGNVQVLVTTGNGGLYDIAGFTVL